MHYPFCLYLYSLILICLLILLATECVNNITSCNDANENIAELLNVEKGTAIFKIEYQSVDSDGNIVEFTRSYLNPSYAEFKFVAEAE